MSYKVHSIHYVYRILEWMVKLSAHVQRDRLDLRHSKAGAEEKEKKKSPTQFFSTLELIYYTIQAPIFYTPETALLDTLLSEAFFLFCSTPFIEVLGVLIKYKRVNKSLASKLKDGIQQHKDTSKLLGMKSLLHCPI